MSPQPVAEPHAVVSHQALQIRFLLAYLWKKTEPHWPLKHWCKTWSNKLDCPGNLRSCLLVNFILPLTVSRTSHRSLATKVWPLLSGVDWCFKHSFLQRENRSREDWVGGSKVLGSGRTFVALCLCYSPKKHSWAPPNWGGHSNVRSNTFGWLVGRCGKAPLHSVTALAQVLLLSSFLWLGVGGGGVWVTLSMEAVLQIYLGNDCSLGKVDSGIKHLSMCLELLPRNKE